MTQLTDAVAAISARRSHVLVTVSGRDMPGITSELTGILAQSRVKILDIAQAVIHGLLSLSILFELDSSENEEREIIKELLLKANEMGLKLEYRIMDPESQEESPTPLKRHHYAVTLIADAVGAAALHRVTAVLAQYQLNIDMIERLSEGCFSCVEMLVSTERELDEIALKKELLAIAKQQEVDIALQAEGLYRRAKRLVVMDMDSTLIQNEVIDELAREHGVYDEVAAITHEAMMGGMDYDESLRRRCAKLAGLPVEALEKVYARIQLTPGARDLIHVLKKLGYRTAVISGGFTFVAEKIKERLGLDFAYANVLHIENGKVSGKVLTPIVNAQRKADLLEVLAQQERIDLDQVVAVGDGANDLLMLQKAGLGIAFNAKPAVREQADMALSQKNMRSILYLLGLSGRDLEQAGLPR